MALMEVKKLKKYFPIKTGLFQRARSFVHAVDVISFQIERGKTFGLVGESGCGKTTCGNCILGILEPTSGEIYFDGRNISKLGRKEMREIRPRMQMVFQDPYSSLNPRKTILQILSDPFKLHTDLEGSEVEEEVLKLLKKVGLGAEHIYRYPYEFSGGQQQRISIARAIATKPDFIFLDEPTSSLDVSVQAQVLNLLINLQKENKLTYLIVTHDIHLIRFITDNVAIMYLGKLMELGSKKQIFNNPTHPYTKALFSAVQDPDPTIKKKRIPLYGDILTPIDPPPGCRFFKRCWMAKKELCDKEEPELLEVEKGHYVACHDVS